MRKRLHPLPTLLIFKGTLSLRTADTVTQSYTRRASQPTSRKLVDHACRTLNTSKRTFRLMRKENMLDRSAGLSYMLARVNTGTFGSESYMTNFKKKLIHVLSTGIGNQSAKPARANSSETTASTVKTRFWSEAKHKIASTVPQNG